MSVKSSTSNVNYNTRWIKKHEETSILGEDDAKTVEYFKRRQIADRVKSAGIKVGNIYKAQLKDDMRVFEYKVTKIDRMSGEVYLKNERGTVRKLHVNDELFGVREGKKKLK